MNHVPEEKKDSVTKTLAILGFLAIIIIIVWLAVKVVALIPSAFSSLASIADSVYNNNRDTELIISTKNSVVNSGESFELTWNKLRGNGSYTFIYECADGVSLDLRTSAGDIETIDCDTFVDLGDIAKVDVMINAEKQRFTDVEYSLFYIRDGAEDIITDKIITVVNATIPTGVTVSDAENATDTEGVTKPTPVTNTPTPTVAGAANEPSTPRPSTNTGYTAGPPQVVTNYIYKIPESNPNGVVDLKVTHLGVGVVQNGIFTSLPQLREDQSGAIRFEIKNVGTKTATDWSYEADLPSDMSYQSDDQKALKPNERVVITLGFKGITRTGTEQFGVEVDAQGDVNTANNDYTWSVKVVD